MTIEQSDRVDGMGIDRGRNEFVLLISDHLPWQDEGDHFSALESKLGAYIEFIRSGQHIETVPQARELPVRIKLVHEHPPTSSAAAILGAIEAQLGGMDIRFSHEGLPSGY